MALSDLFNNPQQLATLSNFLLNFGQGALQAGQAGVGFTPGFGYAVGQGGQGLNSYLMQQQLQELRNLQINAEKTRQQKEAGLAAVLRGTPDLASWDTFQQSLAKPSEMPSTVQPPDLTAPDTIRRIAQFDPNLAYSAALQGQQISATDRRQIEQQKFQAGENEKSRAVSIYEANARLSLARGQFLQGMAKTNFDQENTLRDEFNKGSGVFVTVRDAYNRMKVSADNPSPAGDMSMIFSYMKMLDPNSTVREGEYATAQNAASVPTQVLQVYNRLLNGEKLADTQRQDFLTRAGDLYGAALGTQRNLETEYTRLAKRSGIDPSGVIVDYTKPAAAGGSPGDTKGNASPQPGDKPTKPPVFEPQKPVGTPGGMTVTQPSPFGLSGRALEPGIRVPREGETAINPKTGQRIIFRNGQWQLLQ